MIKHVCMLLIFCFMINVLSFGESYSFSEWVNGYEEMQWIAAKVSEYYKDHERLPNRFEQLEEYGDMTCYYDYGVVFEKTEDSKIEIKFHHGKRNALYKLIYEIDGEQHVETIFKNERLINSCRYSKEGKILEVIDEDGVHSPSEFCLRIKPDCEF